jgi:hypothetical protein
MEALMNLYNEIIAMDTAQVSLDTLIESGFLEEVALPEVPSVERVSQALLPVTSVEKLSIFVIYITESLAAITFQDFELLLRSFVKSVSDAFGECQAGMRPQAHARSSFLKYSFLCLLKIIADSRGCN